MKQEIDVGITANTISVSLPIQKSQIVAVKFIPYFTGSSEKVVIAISLDRIYVNNVAPISVDTCLVHSDKLRT